MEFGLDLRIVTASNSSVINVSLEELINYSWYIENLLFDAVKPLDATRLLTSEYIAPVPNTVPKSDLLALLPKITGFTFNPATNKGIATVVVTEKELNPLVKVVETEGAIALAVPAVEDVINYLLGKK
jgi:hypothetical protein